MSLGGGHFWRVVNMCYLSSLFWLIAAAKTSLSVNLEPGSETECAFDAAWQNCDKSLCWWWIMVIMLLLFEYLRICSYRCCLSVGLLRPPWSRI